MQGGLSLYINKTIIYNVLENLTNNNEHISASRIVTLTTYQKSHH